MDGRENGQYEPYMTLDGCGMLVVKLLIVAAAFAFAITVVGMGA